MARCLGVDGCRGGWAVVTAEQGRLVQAEIAASLAAIETAGVDRIWIDMPIGMPSARQFPREADAGARRLLGPRRASIFSAPCREVLEAADYETASAEHRRLTGKGISKQTWNLVPKIRELAAWHPDVPVYEAHPELVAAGLGGEPMKANKKTEAGQAERIELLKGSDFGPEQLKAWKQEFGGRAAADDWIDAALLAVAASDPALERRTVPEQPQQNDAGEDMAIHYSIRG
ncbi:DUF429 domain-containing protein [Alkalicoccus chagannorensis]|uniref:DUF429 domain-containing protein n=1 Tax=Alkalicoccus chagannorensis TaxID=427072 RepID=UPI000422AF12|nr:DUF429 domain-containing protein [Alkalicoccus chagannorensis]